MHMHYLAIYKYNQYKYYRNSYLWRLCVMKYNSGYFLLNIRAHCQLLGYIVNEHYLINCIAVMNWK
jgi:hypothetical protein